MLSAVFLCTLRGVEYLGSLSNVGVKRISKQTNRSKTRRVAELPSLLLGSTMKDPVSESGEISDSEANTLEHLCFVVAAFSKAIGVVAIEGV